MIDEAGLVFTQYGQGQQNAWLWGASPEWQNAAGPQGSWAPHALLPAGKVGGGAVGGGVGGGPPEHAAELLLPPDEDCPVGQDWHAVRTPLLSANVSAGQFTHPPPTLYWPRKHELTLTPLMM